jgi:hypothetical protein
VSAASVASPTEKVPVSRSAAPTATVTPPAQAVRRRDDQRGARRHPSRRRRPSRRSGQGCARGHSPRHRKLCQREGRRRGARRHLPRRCRRERDRVVLERDREFESLSLHRRVGVSGTLRGRRS